jgi:hypothetical protein
LDAGQPNLPSVSLLLASKKQHTSGLTQQVANQSSSPKRRIGSLFRRISADQGMPAQLNKQQEARGNIIER